MLFLEPTPFFALKAHKQHLPFSVVNVRSTFTDVESNTVFVFDLRNVMGIIPLRDVMLVQPAPIRGPGRKEEPHLDRQRIIHKHQPLVRRSNGKDFRSTTIPES